MARRTPSSLAVFLRAAALLLALPFFFTAYALVGHTLDLALLLPFFPRRRRLVATRLAAHWGSALFRLGTAIGRVTLVQRGHLPAPSSRPLLIIANHQSLLDIPLLLHLCGPLLPRFVLKRELAWGIPNISPATRAAAFAFVDRRPRARSRNHRALQRFAQLLVDDGATGVLFPEGTWETDGIPLPFKPGGLRTLLAEGRFDVLPVVIEGTHRAQRFSDFLRRLGDLSLTVVLAPVIPAAETTDVEALRARLEAHLQSTLTELRTSPENTFDQRENEPQ
ncbi:MAG: lysophospholipid acyltransferase family protein [Minicystis sp.]